MPVNRFIEFAPLTPAELDQVRSLGESPLDWRKGAVIRHEGVVPEHIFFLVDGWASTSITLADGKRQITKVHLPGDLMGLPSVSLASTVETVAAITPVTASKVPVRRFWALLTESPRLASVMFLSAQRERVALMDLLVNIGRRSAAARTGALLLDLGERLARTGRAGSAAFDLPMTQEQIGDVLGLSAVHVNRSLRELGRRGLIGRTGARVTITDRDGLEHFAGWSPRTLAGPIDWLPAPKEERPTAHDGTSPRS